MEIIQYIGDGVYAVWDGNGVELRADSHSCPTAAIYLELAVIASLNSFIKRMNQPIPEKTHD